MKNEFTYPYNNQSIAPIYTIPQANGEGADPKDPLASPTFSDMTGLPPMLVQVGKLETMFGDGLGYAEKARQAGVQVEFDPYDDVIHGWHNSAHVVPGMPEALEATARIGSFFKERAG